MLKRALQSRLHETAAQFPATLIVGPRQCGKTTLAKMAFPQAAYFDLEHPITQRLFKEDLMYQLTRHEEKTCILDEAQVVPEVFSALRSVIDQKRKENGQYILLCSAQPSLIRSIFESLAGRVGVIELTPLFMQELANQASEIDYKTVWLKGGFPDALQGNFRVWWDAYLRAFIERDLAMWGIQADPILTRKVLTMIAHQQGGIFNASEMGRALGVNYHTIIRYVKILENTFFIRLLEPFYSNIRKRLVKSPKIYIRDTGLLHHLLNISTIDDLESHPSRGQSWETFVIEDLIRREQISNPFSQYYFWRTQAGLEVDLVFARRSKLTAIEIKAGISIQAGQTKKLAAAITDLEAAQGYIINQSETQENLAPNIQMVGFSTDFNAVF